LASNDVIKQRIQLEGEKEYSNAIKNANRNLKTLRSELKAETAELGKNATAQQKNEARAKSLQKQIAEQEKIVKACRDALDEVKEKYGDNADAVAKYEQRLNNARTELANMKSSLDDVGDAFKGVERDAALGTVAARSFAESVKDLANVGSTVSDAIGGIFTGMVGTVRDAVSDVWVDLVDLAAKANDWIDMAGFWNTDAATIQKWAHAVGYASGSLEDISDIVTRINSKSNDEIMGFTKVSRENYSDMWQYAMAVMDAMSKMDTQSRNAAAFGIFGRNPQKALDLLNDWGSVLDHLDEFDVNKGGVGMSEEDMATMSDLYDKVNGINELWEAFKDSFEAGMLGKVALDLAGNAEGLLKGLIDFWNADNPADREKAIGEIEKNLTEFFDRLGEALETAISSLDKIGGELQQSDNGIVRTIGSVLQGISQALEWFTNTENIDKVTHAFEALLGIWAAGKITAAIGNLASLAGNLALIKSAGGLFALFGGGQAAGTAASAAGTAASAAGGATISAVVGKAFGTLAKVAPYAAGLAVLLDHSNHGDDAITDANGELTEMARSTGFKIGPNGEVQAPKSIMDDNIIHLEWPQDESPAEVITEAQRAALEDYWDLMRRAPEDDLDSPIWDEFDEMWPELQTLFAGNEALLTELENRMDNAAWGNSGDDWHDWENIPASVFEGIGTDMSGATKSMDNASTTIRNLPSLLTNAIRGGLSSVVVVLDGEKVGTLAAPYVSQRIARDVVSPY